MVMFQIDGKKCSENIHRIKGFTLQEIIQAITTKILIIQKIKLIYRISYKNKLYIFELIFSLMNSHIFFKTNINIILKLFF